MLKHFVLVCGLGVAVFGCFPDVEKSVASCEDSTGCFANEECVNNVCVTRAAGMLDAAVDDTSIADVEEDVSDVSEDTEQEPDTNTEVTEISGRVTDFITGNPVEGARISTSPPSEVFTTGSDGFYILRANIEKNTSYLVKATANKYHSETFTVTLSENRPSITSDIQLLPWRITGRLTDANFPNRTLAGISVELSPPGPQGSPPVMTDVSGQFIFEADSIESSDQETRTFSVIFIDPDSLYASMRVEDVVLGGDPRNPDVQTTLACNPSKTNACGGCGIVLEGDPDMECLMGDMLCMWKCDEFGGMSCQCP